MPNPYDALRDAAAAMAYALADNGHDEADPENEGCLGCAALAEYARAMRTDRPVGFVRSNGAGEIVFRQAGHPSNDPGDPWCPVFLP